MILRSSIFICLISRKMGINIPASKPDALLITSNFYWGSYSKKNKIDHHPDTIGSEDVFPIMRKQKKPWPSTQRSD